MTPSSTTRPKLKHHASSWSSYAADEKPPQAASGSTETDSLFRWEDFFQDSDHETPRAGISQPSSSAGLQDNIKREQQPGTTSTVSQDAQHGAVPPSNSQSTLNANTQRSNSRRSPFTSSLGPAHTTYMKQEHENQVSEAKQVARSLADGDPMMGSEGQGTKRHRSSWASLDTLDEIHWTGDQVNDQLSQSAVRQGHSALRCVNNDKDECSTAKAHLLSSLGASYCMQHMSAFFCSILQERAGPSRSNCPFRRKSPSRITVADKKKEVWFDMLADSAVPLRDHGCSIPHGINGRAMLDKCLEKKIPITRALWLVRSIGAQALRALRRKGPKTQKVHDDQAQWLREWTFEVQSFVGDNAFVRSHAGWKRDIVYVINLATSLHNERLLDREHHLDWILTNLEIQDFSRLPLMLLFARNHQAALLENQASGQRLASACLLHHSKLNDSDHASLRDSCELLLQDLATLAPERFLVPRIWPEVRPTFLRMRRKVADEDLAFSLQRAIDINDEIVGWIDGADFRQQTRNLTTLRMLNAGTSAISFGDLSIAIWDAVPDPNALVSCVLEWATSTYRNGLQDIYLACRLVRHWHQQKSLDVTSCVTAALVNLRERSTTSPIAVARLCAELFRSDHLDPVDYISQLTAKAGLESKLDMMILRSMPTKDLPPGHIEWRKAALRNKHPSPMIDENFLDVKKMIASQSKSGRIDRVEERLPSMELENRLKGLATAGPVFHIAKWLHSSLLPYLARKEEGPKNIFPTHFIRFVVVLLEVIDDFSQLHELLLALSQRCEVKGLMVMASSVEAHGEKLLALGCHTRIWQGLFMRYRSLRTSHGPCKHLSAFFLRTQTWYQPGGELERYLHSEIDMCDTGIAACTPLSDVDFESAEEGKSELDQLLANGPHFDERRLSNALDMMIKHISRCKEATEAQAETIRANLTALKSANEDTFVPLLKHTLRLQLPRFDEHAIACVLPTLLSSSSLGIGELLDCVASVEDDATAIGSHCDDPLAALRILHFFYCADERNNAESPDDASGSVTYIERWQHRLWTKQLEKEHGSALLRLIIRCSTLEPLASQYPGYLSLIAEPEFRLAFAWLIARHQEEVSSMLEGSLVGDPHVMTANLRRLACSAINPVEQSIPSSLPTWGDIDELDWSVSTRCSLVGKLFQTIEPSLLPLYELLMRLLTVVEDAATPSDIAKDCQSHVLNAATRDTPYWTQLAANIDVSVAQELRRLSESSLLSSLQPKPSFWQSFPRVWPTSPKTHATVVGALRSSISTQDAMQKLILDNLGFVISTALDAQLLEQKPEVPNWLQAIVLISLIYERVFTETPDIIGLLYSLCWILQHPGLQNYIGIIDAAHHAACFFVLRIGSSTMPALRKALGPLSQDRRILSMLGEPTLAEWGFPSESSSYPPARGFLDPSSIACSSKRWEELLNPKARSDVATSELLDVARGMSDGKEGSQSTKAAA